MREADVTEIDEKTRPVPRSGVVAYELLDEMVLYQQEQDMVLSLNHTARVIWELCDGRHSVQEIAAELGQELGYKTPIELESLLADVRSAIFELHRFGVLALAA